MPVDFYHGDCLEVLPTLEPNSIDAVVCDPPYHLTQLSRNGSPRQNDTETPFGRTRLGSKGFMGKCWDGGDIAFQPDVWREVLRVLKPGGHLLAMGGTRTYHRLVCAIEDAGFECRDTVSFLYGTGFPKSVDVSKMIDKQARGVPHGGADPTSPNHGRYKGGCSEENETGRGFGAGPGAFMAEPGEKNMPEELVPEAEQWRGFGTALKPAMELICLARKPLIGTIVENVLTHGTGGLNIDECRVPINPAIDDPRLGGNGDWGTEKMAKNVYEGGYAGVRTGSSELGRWPANVILARFEDEYILKSEITSENKKELFRWLYENS